LLLLQLAAPAATLTNRWSFNEPAGNLSVTDSVSHVVGTLHGNASLDGAGNVSLDGVSGSYVSLGSGLLTGMSAVTIDAWFTYTVPNNNVGLFSFDDGGGTGSGGSYLRYNIYDTGNGNGGTNYVEDIVSWGGAKLYGGMVLPQTITNHVTIVYDPVNGMEAIYVNGLLNGSYSGALNALSGIPTASASLGHSPWSAYGDPDLNGTISEFRIWNGAFSAYDALASEFAGPDALPGSVPLTIISQPTSPATKSSGDSATLSVSALSSSTPITYHWKRGPAGGPYTNLVNGVTGSGSTISGATSNVFTIANLAIADTATYMVQLSDTTGTNVTSSSVIINVAGAPVVFTDTTPSAATRYTTKAQTFSALFVGSTPINCQWQVSKDGGTTYTNVPGATSTNLTLNNIQLSDAGYYRLRAANIVGTNFSTAALLTVNDIATAKFNWFDPVPFGSLTAGAILTNLPGSFLEAAVFTGNSTPIPVFIGSRTFIFKADGSSASVTGGNGNAGGAFPVNTTGNAALGSVLDAYRYDGGTHTISLNNLVVGEQYSVQLFAVDDRNVGGSESNRLSNFQDPNDALDVSATSKMGDNVYVVGTFTATSSTESIQQNLLTGGNGNINAVVVRALSYTPEIPPVVLTQPQPTDVTLGHNGRFDVTVDSLGAMTYQWKRGPVGGPYTNLANGLKFSGVTNTTLVISNVIAGDASEFIVAATNSAGGLLSDPADLTIQTNLALIGHWFSGAQDYLDTSGYTPSGTHDGQLAGGTGASFVADVPLHKTGSSLHLSGTEAVVVDNTATSDVGYTNTFDAQISANLSVAFWAKGFPTTWQPWISKNGENSTGFQLRQQGQNGNATFTLRGTAGSDDPLTTTNSNDGQWHHYVGTWEQFGVRRLYIDGVVAIELMDDTGLIGLADVNHLVLGGFDNPGIGRFFTGNLYDVRIYNYALSQDDVAQLAGVPPLLSINHVGANAVLTWSFGTLLETTNIAGPWTTNVSTSPLLFTPTGAQKFYRVQVP
jgi:hypothetical protein